MQKNSKHPFRNLEIQKERLFISVLKKSLLLIFACMLSQTAWPEDNLCEEDVLLAVSRLNHFPEKSDWIIEPTKSSIRLTSKFDVSISSTKAIIVDKPSDAWKRIKQSKFWIEIRFNPMMPYEAYKKDRNQRLHYADKINTDYQNFEGEPMPDNEYEEAVNYLKKNKLASHIAAYSNVYIDSAFDDPELSFDPNENLQKCVWMLYRIGFLFSEIQK